MVWYEDLAEGMLGCVAVGWLEHDHSFTTGTILPGFSAKLTALSERPWNPLQFLGYHYCSLCEPDEGRRMAALIEGHPHPFDRANLFVPGQQAVFLAPRLISHYIEAHGYVPPPQFQDAVLACRPMRSEAYFAALTRVAPPLLRPHLRESERDSF